MQSVKWTKDMDQQLSVLNYAAFNEIFPVGHNQFYERKRLLGLIKVKKIDWTPEMEKALFIDTYAVFNKKYDFVSESAFQTRRQKLRNAPLHNLAKDVQTVVSTTVKIITTIVKTNNIETKTTTKTITKLLNGIEWTPAMDILLAKVSYIEFAKVYKVPKKAFFHRRQFLNISNPSQKQPCFDTTKKTIRKSKKTSEIRFTELEIRPKLTKHKPITSFEFPDEFNTLFLFRTNTEIAEITNIPIRFVVKQRKELEKENIPTYNKRKIAKSYYFTEEEDELFKTHNNYQIAKITGIPMFYIDKHRLKLQVPKEVKLIRLHESENAAYLAALKIAKEKNTIINSETSPEILRLNIAEKMNLSLRTVGLSKFTLDPLLISNLNYVKDISKLDRKGFKAIPGMGMKGLAEIALLIMNLKLEDHTKL